MTAKHAVYLMPDGILDAHHNDAGELAQDVIFSVPVWLSTLSRKFPVGYTDGPQSFARHRLDHLTHHLVTFLWLEGAGLALGIQDM